jgi:hypothetical protein
MVENMVEKTFKGFVIPPLADTPEGREAVRRGHRSDKEYCFLSDIRPMSIECVGKGRRCTDCIACINMGDSVRKHKVFKRYDSLYPAEGKAVMPKLKPGMIIQTSKGCYYLVVVGRKDDVVAYRCLLDIGRLLISDAVSFQADDPDIDAVYDEEGPHWFFPAVIADILRGSERHRIWKRPDPVKEMTVDEISKVLGYKVKVVGSEKADD